MIENEDIIDRIRNVSLVDAVTEKIRKKIHNGDYAAGQKLIVRELSDDLGISHTPIKEALNRLVAEGYIDAAPRKSMVVKKVNIEYFENIVELRAMYEIIGINKILNSNIKVDDCIRSMRNMIDQLNELLDSDNEIEYHQWLEYDFKFHCTYMELIDNQAMYDSYKNLNANRYSYFMFLEKMKHPLTKEDLRKDNKEHEEITKYLEAYDLNTTIETVIKHILRPRLEVVISEKSMNYIYDFSTRFE